MTAEVSLASSKEADGKGLEAALATAYRGTCNGLIIPSGRREG